MQQATDTLFADIGFNLDSELGRGASSVVYRARRTDPSDSSFYAIKLEKEIGPGSRERDRRQFIREAATLARMRHPGLVKVFAAGETRGRSYVVMEYLDGRQIDHLLSSGPLPEQAILSIARMLAGALNEAHFFGVVHRDIKPQNILILPDGQAKLLDFGFATQKQSEKDSEGTKSDEVVGTLYYSSPEQTGVLNRPVDARADLYSLGVVLFQCATARVPFHSQDIGELVHMHLVQAPPRIESLNPAISPALAGIVIKLLSKEPDDRYQSAKALLADLDAIDGLNKALSERREIHLGSLGDAGKLVVADTPLFGRENELKDLLRPLKRALDGKGSVVLVEGDPGIGKSRLVRELVSEAEKISHGKVLVLSGKAMLGDPLPLAPLRDAVDQYLRRLRQLPDEEREPLLETIRSLVSDSGALLRNFSTQLSLLIKDAERSGDPSFSQDLFHGAIVDFLLRLVKLHGSAVIVIDDVQWLDDASYKVLGQLAGAVSELPLLIAGTCRNDADSSERLSRFATDMNSLQVLTTKVDLRALSEDAIGALVSAQLPGNQVDPKLVQQLASRSNGNPFAAGEYLRAMHNAGLLSPYWGRWIVDFERLENLALPSDVIQLVVSRVLEMPDEAKRVLRAAAVWGSRFKTEYLAEVCGLQATDIHLAIQEGVQGHLIEREDSDQYQFVHDRVREALLAEVSAALLQELHQKMAEAIDRGIGKRDLREQDPDLLYALANFYGRGDIAKTARRAFDVNHAAGAVASRNHANEVAFGFLDRALKIAEEHGFPIDSEFDQAIGEVCTFTLRLNDAIAFLESAVSKSSDRVRRAQLLGQVARCQLTGWQNVKAWEQINRALAELGHPLPKTKRSIILTSLGYLLAGWLARRFRFLIDTRKKRTEKQLLVSLLNLSAEIALFMNSKLLLAPTMRAAFHAEWIGVNAAASRTYATLSLLLQAFRRFDSSKRFIDRAMAIAEELGDRVLMSECYYLFGASLTITDRIDEFEQICITVPERYKAWIEPKRYFDMLWGQGWVAMMKGDTNRSAQICEDIVRKSKSMKKSSLVKDYFSPSYHNLNLALRGRVAEGIQDLTEVLAKGVFLGTMTGGDVYSTLLAIRYEQRDFGPGLDDLIKSLHGIAPTKSPSYPMKKGFIVIALIRIDQLLAARKAGRADEVKAALERLELALDDLQQATKGASFYVPTAMLGKAAVALAAGKHEEALAFLAQGHAVATEWANQDALFEIHRMRAAAYLERGKQESAQAEVRSALQLAMHQHWINRIKLVREQFALHGSEASSASRSDSVMLSSTDTVSGKTTEIASKDSLRLSRHLNSLLQVSLASSGVFDPRQQLRIALDEIIKVMGADRAYAFLQKEDGQGLSFAGGRDSQKSDLDEPKGYSRTVVQKVADTQRPLVVTGTEEGRALGSESAVVHDLRSIMAAPLLLRDQFKGVVYLDSRLAKGIFTVNDTEILAGIANHIAIAFETAKLANVEADKRAMQKDLELSASVQALLLPKSPVLESERFSLCGFYRPASQCGGDWWCHHTSADGNLMAIVGDVTGHGAGPAMITASIASHFLSLRSLNEPPGAMMKSLHKQLFEVAEGKYLMTALAVQFEPNNGKLTAWCASAPSAWVLGADGSFRSLAAPGMPLGSAGEFEAGAQETVLVPGDRLFIATDGIHETNTLHGKALGSKTVQRILLNSRAMGPKDALENLIAEVDAVRKGPQEDDYTVVMMDIR